MSSTTLPPPQLPTATPDTQAPLHSVPVGAKSPGITVYDWMAAMAMQGLLTHGMKVKVDRALSDDEKDDEMAQRAYNIAAAMLRARNAAMRTLEKESTPDGRTGRLRINS